MQDYKKLYVWKKSIELNKKIYSIASKFPKNEEYILRPQIVRASVSICSNIVEGAGRMTQKDFAHFLNISLGSINEVECQLLIAKNQGYVSDVNFRDINKDLDELGKMIVGLMKRVWGK